MPVTTSPRRWFRYLEELSTGDPVTALLYLAAAVIVVLFYGAKWLSKTPAYPLVAGAA